MKRKVSDFTVAKKLKDDQIFQPRVDNLTVKFKFPWKVEDHIQNGIPFHDRLEDIIEIVRILCGAEASDVKKTVDKLGQVAWLIHDPGLHLAFTNRTDLRCEFQGRFFCRRNGFLYAKDLLCSMFDNFPEGTTFHLTRVDIAIDILTHALLPFPMPNSGSVKMAGSVNVRPLQVVRDKDGVIKSANTNLKSTDQELRIYCKSAEVIFRESDPIKRDYYMNRFSLSEQLPDSKRVLRVELYLRHKNCLTFFHHAFCEMKSEAEACAAALSHWGSSHQVLVAKKRGHQTEWIGSENFKKLFFLRELKREKWAVGFKKGEFYTSTRKQSARKAVRSLVRAVAANPKWFNEAALLAHVEDLIPRIFKNAEKVRESRERSFKYLKTVRNKMQRNLTDYLEASKRLPCRAMHKKRTS